MAHRRTAGVTLPLFSIRSARDWGVGEIGDLPACARFVRSAGFGILQLLPVYELARGETSPYGARTGFGLDPLYASIEEVPELDPAAIDEALGAEGMAERERLHAAPRVDYEAVRTLKMRALEAAFARFEEREWSRGTRRAKELEMFAGREAGWEDDLALYVALRDEHHEHGWRTWPTAERLRDPASLDEARGRLARRVRFHQYLQWVLHDQWTRARKAVEAESVSLMGDLPFIVGRESADVWANARIFRDDLDLGAPPDGFSAVGQSWGLPPYDWQALAQEGHAWLRARVAHAGRLYHSFRLDHVVGYFRQYVRAGEALGRFDPEEEADQLAHGKMLLGAILEAAGGSALIAEDLGVIPAFVRATLVEMGVPGYKILPWERDAQEKLRDPAELPALSVASYSTHDTAPINAWWPELPETDRARLAELGGFEQDAPADERERGLFRLLFSAPSERALVLAPELFGETTRINVPSTVGNDNWTYRMPAPMQRLDADPAMRARLDAFAAMLRATGRV